MTVETHIRVIQDAIKADHEAWVAEIQALADQAATRGDLNAQRRHLAHIERVQALPKPWETAESA